MVKSIISLERLLNSKKLLCDLLGQSICFLLTMYRPSSFLIEVYGSLGKDWVVYVGLLAVHLINVCFIFACSMLGSLASSSLVNMAASPPESKFCKHLLSGPGGVGRR
jgi:hypothetical protein